MNVVAQETVRLGQGPGVLNLFKRVAQLINKQWYRGPTTIQFLQDHFFTLSKKSKW